MRIAGIDFGTIRVGIAVADDSVGIATPFATYTRCGQDADGKYFCQLVKQEAIEKFVVGLPVHLDGRESEKSKQAREFGAWLMQCTSVATEFFDERYTTFEAEEALQAANLTKKQRNARRDQLAAQIMLTAYLESGLRGQSTPLPLDDSP